MQKAENYIEEEVEFNEKLNSWYYSFKQDIRKFEKNLGEKLLEMKDFLGDSSKSKFQDMENLDMETQYATNLRKLVRSTKDYKSFLNEEFHFDLEEQNFVSRMNSVMMVSYRDSYTGDYNGMARSQDTTFKVGFLTLRNPQNVISRLEGDMDMFEEWYKSRT